MTSLFVTNNYDFLVTHLFCCFVRLPWRLSKIKVKVLDKLVRSMWWPHYTDKLCSTTASFWTKSSLMWKAKHKSYILLVLLPTLLDGFVTAVHTAVLMIVNALRHLDGLVVSKSEAHHLGIEPGSHVVEKASIPYWRQELLRGFVLLEGSLPVATLNPASHHFSHYGHQTSYLGILRWMAMWSFERNNKHIKGMVHNNRYTLTSLAKAVQMNIATRFISIANMDVSHARRLKCSCYLSLRRAGKVLLSRREQIDLAILGINNFEDIHAFEIAYILGEHFRAGEWGRVRCGSVITTIFDGRSRYCYVKKFFKVQGKRFARVEWLSVPTYPHAPNRLKVIVTRLTDEEQNLHPQFLPLEKIEPCKVAVIPNRDRVHFFMLRSKGYDRVSSI